MTVVVLGKDTRVRCVNTASLSITQLDKCSDIFCNRQQHNYFVLLFVSFCTKKKKRGKKGKRVDVFNVFFVPGGLGSTLRAALLSRVYRSGGKHWHTARRSK